MPQASAKWRNRGSPVTVATLVPTTTYFWGCSMFLHSFGYAASLFIGVSLGLIGSGGSILTVPILVYLFGVDPVLAISGSLFIVGATSFIGVVPKFREGLVDIKAALLYGIPSLISVYLTRRFVITTIPTEVVHINNFVVTKGILLLSVFAILMILASTSMIMARKLDVNTADSAPPAFSYPKVFGSGSAVGFLTGLVGAGGGFLIIPTLVFLCNVPIRSAIATSLLIISSNSLLGLSSDRAMFQAINWPLMLAVLACASVGILAGNHYSHRVSDARLKKAFGWFVLIVGICILGRESFASFA